MIQNEIMTLLTLSVSAPSELLKINEEICRRNELAFELNNHLDPGDEVEIVIGARGMGEFVMAARVSGTEERLTMVVPERTSLDQGSWKAMVKRCREAVGADVGAAQGDGSQEGALGGREGQDRSVEPRAESRWKPLMIRNEFTVLISLSVDADDFLEIDGLLSQRKAFLFACGTEIKDGDRIELALGVRNLGEVTLSVKMGGREGGDTVLVPEPFSAAATRRWEELRAECSRRVCEVAEAGGVDARHAEVTPQEVTPQEVTPQEVTARAQLSHDVEAVVEAPEREEAQRAEASEGADSGGGASGEAGAGHRDDEPPDSVWKPVIIRNKFMTLVSLRLSSPDEFLVIDRQLSLKNELVMEIAENLSVRDLVEIVIGAGQHGEVTIGAKVKTVEGGKAVFSARKFDKNGAASWRRVRQSCQEAVGADAGSFSAGDATTSAAEVALARPEEPFTENTIRAVRRQVRTPKDMEIVVWDEESGGLVGTGLGPATDSKGLATSGAAQSPSQGEPAPALAKPPRRDSKPGGVAAQVPLSAPPPRSEGGAAAGAAAGAGMPPSGQLPSDSFRAAILNGLASNAPSWEGAIGQCTIASWLIKASKTAPTSLLKIESVDDNFLALIHKGRINDIQCYPGSVTFSLGTLISQTKQVEGAQLKEAILESQNKGVDLGLILTAHKVLDDARLAMIRQIRAKFLSKMIINTREGSVSCYALEEMPFEVEISTPEVVEVVESAATAYIKGINHKDLGQLRENLRDKYPRKVDPLPTSIDAFEMDKNELEFWREILDGSYRLKDLLGKSNLNITKSLQLIFRLERLGMICFSDEGEERAVNYSMHTNKVEGFVRSLELATHFEVLGVDWVADRGAIVKAYADQKATFAISRFPEAVQEQISGELVKILMAIEAAYAALIGDSSRRRYRLKEIGKEKVGVAVAGFIQRGEMARWKGEEKSALSLFAQARELNPGVNIPQ